MTALANTPTEITIFTLLRTALQAVLNNIEVVKGISNDVPQPLGNYVLMTPLLQERLGTNTTILTETLTGIDRTEKHDVDYQIQLDFYGANSGNNVAIVANLFRCDWLFQYGITPLFASEPSQLAFMSGEKTMIERWVLDVHLQQISTVLLPGQQSATELTINSITEVDTL
jgi:hypothetical protein